MFSKLATVVRAACTVALGAALLGPVAGAAQAQPGAPVLGGGSGIVIDDAFECTLTTVGYDGAGRLVGITAGHCGDPGAQVYAEADRGAGVVGRFVHSDPRLDYAVIQFQPGRVTPVNRVGNVTIAGIGGPAAFPMIVCKEGRTTGNTCGISWGDVFATNIETWSQMCVVEGDSGAPVVVGNQLVGMVNAYLAFACYGPEVGTNMTTIMDDLNGRNSIGSGFRPI
ncbi:S1 family peptidase [Nocardia sp. NPDC057227]|uniref:S1 family peptidase n=1 Tax=Nocardia sp. NPDC057227 TaxID=3346056 RepID=UPI003642D050